MFQDIKIQIHTYCGWHWNDSSDVRLFRYCHRGRTYQNPNTYDIRSTLLGKGGSHQISTQFELPNYSFWAYRKGKEDCSFAVPLRISSQFCLPFFSSWVMKVHHIQKHSFRFLWARTPGNATWTKRVRSYFWKWEPLPKCSEASIFWF